jgi:hypothetical protein
MPLRLELAATWPAALMQDRGSTAAGKAGADHRHPHSGLAAQGSKAREGSAIAAAVACGRQGCALERLRRGLHELDLLVGFIRQLRRSTESCATFLRARSLKLDPLRSVNAGSVLTANVCGGLPALAQSRRVGGAGSAAELQAAGTATEAATIGEGVKVLLEDGGRARRCLYGCVSVLLQVLIALYCCERLLGAVTRHRGGAPALRCAVVLAIEDAHVTACPRHACDWASSKPPCKKGVAGLVRSGRRANQLQPAMLLLSESARKRPTAWVLPASRRTAGRWTALPPSAAFAWVSGAACRR